MMVIDANILYSESIQKMLTLILLYFREALTCKHLNSLINLKSKIIAH